MSTREGALWGDTEFQHYAEECAMRTEMPDFSDDTNGVDEYYAELFGRLDYPETAQKALADPNYDFFSHFKPTKRTKHDIGYYVMQNGIDVPLITSHSEWQAAMREGTAMLRSDGRDDYEGWSGLFTTKVLPVFDPEKPSHTTSWTNLLYPSGIYDATDNFGAASATSALSSIIARGLYDGTVNPSRVMAERYWSNEYGRHMQEANQYGFRVEGASLEQPRASHWHYEKGVPIRVFRDPAVEGRYYIGGTEAHHNWQIEDGRDSAELIAYEYKRWERLAPEDRKVAYTLPPAEIVDMYEEVRTLPFFDQRQAPVMELLFTDPDLKSGEQKMKFLQYFKVNQLLQQTPAFTLPSGRNILPTSTVRGATDPDGIDVRIYLAPNMLTPRMDRQGIFMNMLHSKGIVAQAAAKMSRVVVMHELSFKDNHDDSAAIYRPDITLGLWDGVGNHLAEPFLRFEDRLLSFDHEEPPRYIDARVTSNGRQATVESDWTPRYDR